MANKHLGMVHVTIQEDFVHNVRKLALVEKCTYRNIDSPCFYTNISSSKNFMKGVSNPRSESYSVFSTFVKIEVLHIVGIVRTSSISSYTLKLNQK